jgi:hypothetical protein
MKGEEGQRERWIARLGRLALRGFASRGRHRGRVTFTERGSTTFDASGDAQTPECTYPQRPRRTTKVTCNVPSPLDAIVLAGINGDDNISATGCLPSPEDWLASRTARWLRFGPSGTTSACFSSSEWLRGQAAAVSGGESRLSASW